MQAPHDGLAPAHGSLPDLPPFVDRAPRGRWSPARVADAAGKQPASLRSPAIPADARPPFHAGARVLIIDDRISDGDVLCVSLRLEGYRVESVQTGIEGLRRVRAGALDLVVLDLHLPDRHGLEVLAGIRDVHPNLRVIVMTGVCLDEEFEHAARALGIEAFLRKPVYADELVEAIGLALQRATALAFAPAEELAAGFEGNPDGGDCREAIADLLPMLYRRTQAAFPRESPQLVVDAVDDAVMEMLARAETPASVAPGDIPHMLMAAWRNMANLVESEARRRAREKRFADEHPEPEAWLDSARDPEAARDRAWLLALATDDVERRGMERWLDDASAEEIAEALGCRHLPLEEQRREVKRFKDRMIARARRRLSKPEDR